MGALLASAASTVIGLLPCAARGVQWLLPRRLRLRVLRAATHAHVVARCLARHRLSLALARVPLLWRANPLATAQLGSLSLAELSTLSHCADVAATARHGNRLAVRSTTAAPVASRLADAPAAAVAAATAIFPNASVPAAPTAPSP
eukprot:151317-Chlamydomonas_euryale.AAC.19